MPADLPSGAGIFMGGSVFTPLSGIFQISILPFSCVTNRNFGAYMSYDSPLVQPAPE